MPTVHEEQFWVVRTLDGYFAQSSPDAAARTDAPVQEATRLPPAAARAVAAASNGWEAQPAALRVEANPVPREGWSYYTLATWGAEYTFGSKRPLDWKAVVEEAVRREELDSADCDAPWEPKDILPILDILIEKYGLPGHSDREVRPGGGPRPALLSPGLAVRGGPAARPITRPEREPVASPLRKYTRGTRSLQC